MATFHKTILFASAFIFTACGADHESKKPVRKLHPVQQSLAAAGPSHMITGSDVNIRDANLNILDTASRGEKVSLIGRKQSAMGHTFLEVRFVNRSYPKSGWVASKYIGEILDESFTAERHIVINLSENRLYYYEDESLIRSWNVGTARAGKETPTGHYTIREKEECPPYFGSLGDHNVPGCSAENPFGQRVLWFIGTMYGIHGTNQPWLIEEGTNTEDRRVSGGCVRNENENINWLFDRVEAGDPVDIVW